MASRARSRPIRRLRPRLELLEGRRVPTLDVQFSLGLGVAGTNPDIRANATAIDSAGNTYLTGSLRGSADFSAGQGTGTLKNSGGRDLYLAKYSPTGALIWARALAGAASNAVAQGSALAIDPLGNLLLTGSYTGTVTFGPGSATLTSTSKATDPFVAKFNANGDTLWARGFAETSYDVAAGRAITTDVSGNVFVTGAFAETLTVGSTSLIAGGQSDAFVAKLDASGNVLWATATQGGSYPAATTASGMAVDASGRVAVCGTYSSTVTFFPVGAGFVLTSAGNTDAYLWVLNASGQTTGAQSYGGADHDEANALGVDASGNFVLTGTFTGTATFGGTSLNASGANDIDVWKVAPSGQTLWAESFAGTAAASVGRGVVVSASGTILVTGDFAGTVDFDPGPSSYTLTSAGGTDVFVTALDASGNFVAARSLGGTGTDYGFGIALNTAGTVAIAGTYTGPAAFGTTNLAKLGPPSIFVATLSSPTSTPPAPSAPVLEAASDTGASSSDEITAATSPVLDVNSAIAGNLVDLLRDGVVIATRNGPGALTDPGPVPSGTHVYTAQQHSSSGPNSPASAATSITFLTTPPPAPPAPTLLPADDSGTQGDNLTNINTPRLTGTATANATIQLLNAAGTVIGSTTSGADGSYTIAPTAPLADATYSLTLRAIDAAGNISKSSPALTLTINTTAPTVPAAPSLLPADDSGTKGDNLTNINIPRLTGTAAANATIQLLNAAGTVIGTATAAANGTYTIAPSAFLTDGTNRLAVRAINSAGNASVTSPSLTLTILTTPPPAPSTPTLSPADDSGTQGDGLTNVNQPHLTGTAAVNVNLRLLDGSGNLLGTAIAGGNGAYTLQPTSPLADGTYALSVRAVDAAGNLGSASPSLTLTIQTTAPSAPAAPTLLAADDSGTQGDNLTNINTPRLTGTAKASVTVQLLNGSGTVIGSTTSGADGSYTIAPTSPMADGPYNLAIRLIDTSGNIGPSGATLSLTIDTTAPAAPTAPTLLPADDSATKGDNLTNINNPRLTGTAQPNATIQLLNAGTVIGTTTTGTDGSFTISPTATLLDGTYSLTLQAVDAAGNISKSSPALTLTIDTTAPSAPTAPTLLPADDSGTLGDNLTNINTPRLTGTTAANATIQLLNAAGTVIGSTSSGADGSYTVAPTSSLPDGSIALTVRAVDAAGNIGKAGPALSLTIATAPPVAPAAPTLLAADDSGTKGDNLTNLNTPRLTGTATANATVQLLNASGTVLGSTTSGADGSYTIVLASPLANGTLALAVRVVDRAGNVGKTGAVVSLTIDTTAPAAPLAPTLLAADDTGVLGDGITTVSRPRLTGVAEAGATVQILDATGKVVAVAIAGADGTYLAGPLATLAPGGYQFRALATDAAGNTAAAGPALALTILAPVVSPPPPTLLLAEQLSAAQPDQTIVRQPHFVGTAAAGSTIQLLNANGVVVATAKAAADGSYLLAPGIVPLGTSVWRVQVIDTQGNASIPSAPLWLTVLSTA